MVETMNIQERIYRFIRKGEDQERPEPEERRKRDLLESSPKDLIEAIGLNEPAKRKISSLERDTEYTTNLIRFKTYSQPINLKRTHERRYF